MNIKYSIVLVFLLSLGGCLSEFEEYKGDDERLTSKDVSARYFFTNTQVQLWMPPTWDYVFTDYMYGSEYGQYATFGSVWETPDALYDDGNGWPNDARSWSHYSNYFRTLTLYLSGVQPGGEFENPLMEAVGLIMKSTYFHKFTEMWGEIPYSQVGLEGVFTPEFDTQKQIYEGLIADLNAAIIAIGEEIVTGQGVDDLAEYDVMFGGNLQKWKAYANGLKLRIALRAKGAPGETFADKAISEALSSSLPTEDIKIMKDMQVPESVAAYEGDIHTMRKGGRKDMTYKFLHALLDNNDPRIDAYAAKCPGGTYNFTGYYKNNQSKVLVDYLVASINSFLGDSPAVLTAVPGSPNDAQITIPGDKYYIGREVRFNDATKPFLNQNKWELYSFTHPLVRGRVELGKENDLMIMPLAEVKLMQAEAAVLGFGGNAETFYKQGIEASMNQWGVSDNGYLSSAMAKLNGSPEEKLQQIGYQLWLALFMVDTQGWSVIRDFNLEGVADLTPNDPVIFSLDHELGRRFPQRLKYTSPVLNLNGENAAVAISRQGPNTLSTQLWFAKGSKL